MATARLTMLATALALWISPMFAPSPDTETVVLLNPDLSSSEPTGLRIGRIADVFSLLDGIVEREPRQVGAHRRRRQSNLPVLRDQQRWAGTVGPGLAWRSRYPNAGRLLGQPIQTQLIAAHWNDLLRLVASMKFGHTTASLLIAKLHASRRQSTLAKALHEYGRLIAGTLIAEQ